MDRRAVALLLLLLLAPAARAEVYRCREPDGALRFTGDPRGCTSPEPHPPDPDRIVIAPPSAEAAVPAAGAREPRPGAAAAAPATPFDPERLQALLPPAPAGWETTREAVEIERDAALRAHGLLASVSRHYGRVRGPVSELCTVEIWSFARADQAAAALASLDGPETWKRVSGALLVLARGIRMERGVGSRRGLVPGCQALASSVASRAH